MDRSKNEAPIRLQATVKAGSCQQEFNSLNAEYATMKQGLANLGLSSKTVDKKSEGTITEGTCIHPLRRCSCIWPPRPTPGLGPFPCHEVLPRRWA